VHEILSIGIAHHYSVAAHPRILRGPAITQYLRWTLSGGEGNYDEVFCAHNASSTMYQG